jgi:acetoin:2,6-dichlorophenolindophenol oxidoreductase subunit beta
MISNMTYVEAIRLAQRQVLAGNNKTFILGLGSSDPKGMFGTNLGLVEEFGNQRVMDAPLSENTLTGVSIGMAAMGYKPILVHHRLDFTLTAFEQMVNQAAKWFFNSGGKSNLPFFIRMVVGRGWGQGPTHGQSLQTMFAHIPGLKVIMPATPQDAGNMIVGGINDGNPVIYIEHRWLHGIQSEVTRPFDVYKIGTARLARVGSDFTLVANSYAVIDCLIATKFLETKGITCDVIDMRSIQPWDKEMIFNSVVKTKKILVMDTGHMSFGVSGEIITSVVESLWGELKSKPIRLGFPDIPVPSAPGLSKKYYPGPIDIIKKVCSTLGVDLKHEELEQIIGKGPFDIPPQGLVGPF